MYEVLADQTMWAVLGRTAGKPNLLDGGGQRSPTPHYLQIVMKITSLLPWFSDHQLVPFRPDAHFQTT